MSTTHLLYLHGFRSSPRSFKAQRMADWLRAHRPDVQWWCPQLPPSPRDAAALILDGTADWPTDGMAAVGSSLGGFYATVVAERRGCPAVLLNPVVDPVRALERHAGDEPAAFFDELRALAPAAITRPERYFAVIAKGDELLDWREMTARYAGAGQLVLEGSDHALSDFDAHLPAVLDFLRLR